MSDFNAPASSEFNAGLESALGVRDTEETSRPFCAMLDAATWARWQEVPPIVESVSRNFFLQPSTAPAWQYIPFPLVSDTIAYNSYIFAIDPPYVAVLLLNVNFGVGGNETLTFLGTGANLDVSIFDVTFYPPFDWGGPATTTFIPCA